MSNDTAPGSSPLEVPMLLDVAVPLPDIWTFHELDADGLAAATDEMVAMLDGKVDDPAALAAASVAEFLDKIGGGGTPLLMASFREEMDDDSILTASLTVTKNDLGGSLDPWREAYAGADIDEVEVMGVASLRVREQTNVEVGDLFDGALTIVTWRYLVPFGRRSILIFTFSTPNAELDELMLEHFDTIMSWVEVAQSGDPQPADTR